MLKNKINFKLINICLFVLTCFFVYESKDLWIDIIKLLYKIFLPFFLAVLFAYAISPAVKFFEKKIPKIFSIILVIFIIILIISIIFILFIPILFKELNSLFSYIIAFVNQIQSKYNIDIFDIQNTLTNYFNSILMDIYKYLSNYLFGIINIITNYFTFIVIFIVSTIYFLISMDSIRSNIKKILINKKLYELFKNIDIELKKYFKSFFKIMFITFFEYSSLFLIIGHPNYLVLGLLAALASFIPFFGGIMVNILAAITAIVISSKLFIRTIILFCILSLIDGYVINPIVYGKSNKIPPILTIFSAFVGGILFKLLGIIVALPLTIIFLTIFRFFKTDIYDKIKKEMSKYKEE